MFQTNQGPSFPAHQFLFSGTSAPVYYDDSNDPCNKWPNEPCWKWFDAENPSGTGAGCIADSGTYSYDIDPNSQEGRAYTPPPPLNQPGYPCYDHRTLVDLLDGGNVTWKYYARSAGDLWTAPTAINLLCNNTKGPGPGANCSGTEWKNNVRAVLPNQGNYLGDHAPILKDIENCNLPQVSWVIPDGNWSDHSDTNNAPGDGGPSWVAAIVNAVGNSWKQSLGGQKCDYWGGYSSAAEPTVILVVWDDWGGYYDDVVPPDCPPPGPCTGYLNGGGNGKQYVYSFRVPLLAVSAYAVQTVQPPAAYTGYVSNVPHDFGSILNFIEYAFGTGKSPLGGQYGIGDQNWPYADYFVMDKAAPPNNYSLYDFFNFQGNPNPFTPITGWKYPPSCFHVPKPPGGGCFSGTYPMDPDNDANE